MTSGTLRPVSHPAEQIVERVAQGLLIVHNQHTGAGEGRFPLIKVLRSDHLRLLLRLSSLILVPGRQIEGKGCAFAGCALHDDIAVVPVDDAETDAQAEADSSLFR